MSIPHRFQNYRSACGWRSNAMPQSLIQTAIMAATPLSTASGERSSPIDHLMVVDSVTGEVPTRIAQWMLRYLRLAAGFGALLLAALFVVDLLSAPPRFAFLALHLLRITVVLLYLIVAGGRRFEDFWRPATFVVVSSLLLADAGLSLSRGADERFVIEAILTLMGCAAFVPWGVRWQMLLVAIAFSALALDCTFGAPD